MNDEEIVELYFKRNERAIGETDAKYGKRLNALSFRITQCSSDSEECATIRIWRFGIKFRQIVPIIFTPFYVRSFEIFLTISLIKKGQKNEMRKWFLWMRNYRKYCQTEAVRV